jgi:type II restriction enzyme
MHQFVDAGIALYNPDELRRPVNSPKAVYQIEPATLAVERQLAALVAQANSENVLREVDMGFAVGGERW